MCRCGLSAREKLGAVPGFVVDIDVTGFDEPGLKTVLGEVRAAQRCLDGLVTRVGVQANELAREGRSAPADETARGDGSVGARQARREAARATVAEQSAGVGDAMSNGALSGEHADSIVRHTAKLSEEQRAVFDFDELVARAVGLPPETFDRLVKRLVEQVLGDGGLGEANTQRAASEFRHWVDHKTGMGRFSGSLDPERYELAINAVEQHMNAMAQASTEPVAKNANLAAAALVELITGKRTSGGLPSITVIVDHDTIVHDSHAGSVKQTETGTDLASETVARLCCDAVIRRVTLDKRRVPINVGRKHRTATDAQWAALKAMHHSCAWDGCTAPINWCQAHHIREWEHGGLTDLDNLVPLCNRHHHQVHEGQWSIKLTPDRRLEIEKPDGSHHATIPTPKRC